MDLHQKAIYVSRQYMRIEKDVIEVLQEIDRTKLYLKFHHSCLRDYATKEMGFSVPVAYAFIAVARKALEIKALQAAIADGLVNVSTAKRITSVLTLDNAPLLIEKAQTLTQKELEREVAAINPRLAVKESARYVSRDRLEVKIGVSEELLQKINRAQDLESQRQKKACTIELTLETVLEDYLNRYDPIKKAQRRLSSPSSRKVKAKKSHEGSNSSVLPKVKENELNGMGIDNKNFLNTEKKVKLENTNTGKAKASHSFRFIPAKVRHQITLRDQGQCTFVNPQNQTQCSNKRWLEVHHKVPVNVGGANTLENLVTLCSGHHKVTHELQLLL